MPPKIIPVTKMKPGLLRYVSEAEELGQNFIITKNGQPSAVLLGYDEWESWLETVEILSDSEAMKRINKSKEYFDKGGKGKSLEEVFDK